MDLSKINLSSYMPAMPYKVRELFDKATNIVMNYTETEAKVVEATNDESWGPSGKLLQELSQLSYSYEHYTELMGMLWKRCFGQDKKLWRRTYKSLLVLTYLIRNGSDKVVTSAREHLYDLKSLESFSYHDEQGKDQGINVRHKVKEIVEFIQDDDRLRDERKKAKVNRDKYVGVGSDTSSCRYGDRWNDYEESSSGSNSTRKKDFVELDGRWRSTNPSIFEEGFNKAEDLANKMKEMVLDQRRPSHDYSPDVSDDENRYSKKSNEYHDSTWNDPKPEYRNKTKESDFEVTKTSTTANKTRSSTNTTKKPQMAAPVATPVTPQAPVVDLLGGDDDDGFAPYVQAPTTQSPLDDDFGQFQEATDIPTKQVIPPTTATQASVWTANTNSTPSVPPSSVKFDPFDLFQQTTTSTDLLQPMSTTTTKPAFPTTNNSSSNDLDFFMTSPQPTQQTNTFFAPQQQSFVRPQMFPPQQPMMFPSTQQQFNRPNNNSFNNTWTSAHGKIDISLNNLIPHTRGDAQKSSLPLNQLTSPTSPTNSGFPSQMMMMNNNNIHSMFPNSTLPTHGVGSRPILK
ncbi:unnamed protein product [Adineta ricciae]|uniref:ENTH domain-containing protein n=1 Tax=Adineta ricciae TaxID=249248 RepID=A0A815XZS7_ADIRI|nr:unnamed protein product [Adineta ricciae]CAF1563819.1 unnamed protein product [Adineta ricciae]